MRDLALGAIFGVLFGVPVALVMLFVYRRVDRVLTAPWPGTLAILVGNGTLVLVVLLRPFTHDWVTFLRAWYPSLVITGLVFDKWMRGRSL
jgi:hypothetical protein